MQAIGLGSRLPNDAETAAGETPSSGDAPAANSAAGTELNVEAGEGEQRPILRLRNRRRRRRAHAPGLLPGPAESAAPSDGSAPDPAKEGEPATPTPGIEPGQRSFRVPRRRRRHTPLAAAKIGDPAAVEATGDASSGAEGASGDGAAHPGAQPGSRPARSRNRRRRTGPPGTSPDGAAAGHGAPGAARGTAGRTAGASAPRDRGGENRPTGGQRDNAGRAGERQESRASDAPRDRRDRAAAPGRGRAGPPTRPERQTYSVDAVVDRGFEDVDEEEGETRRVHWTIVKRTTADQASRKPVRAVYVLQRDGVDTEFSGLGAARNAVNKTIVHPEKLTRSKAEHTAAKK